MIGLMSVSVYEVLEDLEASATSEADKGSKFERLMQAYLRTDPVFAEQFSDVWLWKDWPGRGEKHDTGIDLVAVDRIMGGNVAIQCKFYATSSTISKGDIDSFLSASGKQGFSQRIIVSTTDKWNKHAEDAVQGQQVPVRRIGLTDLQSSEVDWGRFAWSAPQDLAVAERKELRTHQEKAVEAVKAGLAANDRGKLIMACGTGKTFTSLRLAEEMVGAGGSVLFLVPSISLLSQTLREWAGQAKVPLAPVAVCSDRKATARSKVADEDISAVDLALPSTTNVAVLKARLTQALKDSSSMTVVFSTYQSIDVIAQAQSQGELGPFDLAICDEAHRTTGVTLAGEDESPFVRVHDNAYVQCRKRLYMTATPRLYDDTSKAKAGESAAVLASMDDEAVYGRELHRLSFGDAVSGDLLTDYKVLVLAVDEESVSRTFQVQLADDGNELKLDDAAKIVGCWNGLAKRGSAEHSFTSDPVPMQRAVAFAGTIKDSKQIESLFAQTVTQYAAAHGLEDQATGDPVLTCEIRHVDGSFNALERNTRLDWLRAPVPDGACRILTNARCLSEGVDVPALDAVMFLSPRKSVVDIVQSVGRVMRKAPGKEFGYIILPVGIPAGTTPEQALRDNKRYAVVWEVLQALRAHDERFNAMVNRIELVERRDDKVNVIGVPEPGDGRTRGEQSAQAALSLAFLDEWREAIYAKVVAKVGSRRYWQQWAKDIAGIATRHTTRITALLDGGDPKVTAQFDEFLDGLRGILNDGITQADAVEMLAQHLITRPVFEALFAGYAFTENNPVAQTMESMLARLDEHSLDDENHSLEKFYDSVRMRVQGVDTAEGRQKLIVQLYDTFFATAFAKTVDRLGIVYTPVEIVDFVLRSADDVLRTHFGQGLTSEDVHILDGFTGTGTFIIRLLQLGLIEPHDLARKYAEELHANEILLLAYYIAAVNIETTYQDTLRGHLDDEAVYEPFPGLVLTDTFQSYEDGDTDAMEVFPATSRRIARQRGLPITVIVGNPPYSSGQDSANDDNANQSYHHLDASIRDTYAARSTATNKNSLYDSYIRAIRWASLRIGDRGVIAQVTNGGWLDSNTADGMRLTLAEEFSEIHVYNLRGNQRTAGEQSRQEGGKVFGGGSRATVAITVLVKDPNRRGPATIHYTDIGDYLTREDKLTKITEAGSVTSLPATEITPNAHGDWLNQRSDEFETFVPLGDKEGGPAVFGLHSRGLASGRDAWVTGSSGQRVLENMHRMAENYNALVERAEVGERTPPVKNPKQISWNRNLEQYFARGRYLTTDSARLRRSTYRPFFKQHTYFHREFNDMVYRLNDLFPTPQHDNHGFTITGPSSHYDFCLIAADAVPDLHLLDTGQFFARWRYEKAADDGMLALDSDERDVVDGYRKIDNITDHALALFRESYGDGISKDDIFHYCYALLHSPGYRTMYAADLKKSLPRIPLVTDPWSFVDSGRKLSELHLGYESIAPYPLEGLDVSSAEGRDAYEFFRVEKMRFAKVRDPRTAKRVDDRMTIVYNSKITLSGIPEEAYRYMLGSRSAVEWIMDRYQVKTDKTSGIVNDPNEWSAEVGDPRYVLDLLARVVAVSLETMRIVDALPALEVRRNSRTV